MRYLIIITLFGLLLFLPVFAVDGQEIKEKTTSLDTSEILPDDYFINKAFNYVQKPQKGFITKDNKVSFKLHEFIKGPGGPTIKLQHLVDGVPVKFSIFYIHFKTNGKIYETGGNYYKVPASLNTSPAINKEQAEKIALDALPPPLIEDMPPVEIVKSELLIDKIGEEYKLIWTIVTGYGTYHVDALESKIDAHTGEILSTDDGFIY